MPQPSPQLVSRIPNQTSANWSPAQNFIYTRTYSRWLEEEQRREKYPETIQRYLSFMKAEIGDAITDRHLARASEAMLSLSVLPSMRALWAAGPVLKENNFTCYNCSYCVISEPFVFSEILFILMSGTGVGFSVEREYVDKLPYIQSTTGNTVRIQVPDTREGWAASLHIVLENLWAGNDIEVDYSLIRPRGSRLKTMGGRASGADPLKALFEFCVDMFRSKRERRQRRLLPIDCLDIANKVAEIVVAGGVRRSSEICLSDLDDMAVASAKTGEFWREHAHRAMSNNSAVYLGRPDALTFLEEFGRLIRSRAGERGIFNRDGARKQMMMSGRRQDYENIGVNPCAEIILRDQQLCNLSSIVVRPGDTLETLRSKVRTAVMFGVWQSSFTSFPYARPAWKVNCDEERLLGVSMSGIMDHSVLNNVNDTMKRWLADLHGVAITECGKWSRRIGIPISAAITTVKPEGTSSALVDSSSGIHPRYAEHYIRRYRISATDPLFRLMRDQGVAYHPEVGQDPQTASTMVLEFPVKAPHGCKTRNSFTALQQLEHWLTVKNFWCEHQPSMTCYVGDEEWPSVSAWVYEHFDDVCGLSFLPRSNHVYQLAPYSECTEPEYKVAAAAFPVLDFDQLSSYEMEDNTDGARSYACTGDKCDI